MSDRQFADSFAISQVSPGPNIIIVTLIGYHVAGSGRRGCRATAAMCGPTCVLALRRRAYLGSFQGGCAGASPFRPAWFRCRWALIAASAFVLARSADHNI